MGLDRDDLVVIGLYLVAAAAFAYWVFVDIGRRGLAEGRLSPRLGWALLTLIIFPVVMPLYLLIFRSPWDRTQCPSCGATGFGDRATCWQCGSSHTELVPFWGIGDVLWVVVLLFVFGFVLVGLTRAFVNFDTLSVQGRAILLIEENAVLVGLTVYVVRVRYHFSLTALGLHVQSLRSLLAQGVLFGLLALLLGVSAIMAEKAGLAAVIGSARVDLLAAAERSRGFFAGIHAQPSPSDLIWLGIGGGVVGPVGEEIVFRGFIYPALRGRMRLSYAVLVSALVFALAHVSVLRFLDLLTFGVLVAILFERTRSLVPAIAVHALNNGAVFLLGILAERAGIVLPRIYG